MGTPQASAGDWTLSGNQLGWADEVQPGEPGAVQNALGGCGLHWGLDAREPANSGRGPLADPSPGAGQTQDVQHQRTGLSDWPLQEAQALLWLPERRRGAGSV